MQIQALPPAILKRVKQLEMPVLYAEAIRAIQACTTMDEAKYYSDKSDALAAYAKMYGDETLSKEAARAKLYAYAKMGQLAGELRPKETYRKGIIGSKPGPRSLLMEAGLTDGQAASARRLAQLPEATLAALIEKAPSPNGAYVLSSTQGSTDAWLKFRIPAVTFRGHCRYTATESAKEFSKDEAEKARAIILEITDWLDAFEQALPKDAP